jgi:tryptophan-rich sensory protein
MIGLRGGAAATAVGYAGAVIGAGFAAAKASQGGQGSQTYRRFKQAPFAPPPSAFGPAWTVNKVGTSWSTTRVATAGAGAADARARQVALGAAVVNEVAYLAFPFAYFKTRSPWLALAVTATSAAATLVQLDATRRIDLPAAAALLPVTAWLALATPVAAYQAMVNPDPFLGTPAPLAR